VPHKITDSPRRYELVIWSRLQAWRPHPDVCPSAGREQRYGPFGTAQDARTWLNSSAISTRPPWMFALQDLETGKSVMLTGFKDSDWTSRDLPRRRASSSCPPRYRPRAKVPGWSGFFPRRAVAGGGMAVA
jgi:hypothetical protein